MSGPSRATSIRGIRTGSSSRPRRHEAAAKMSAAAAPALPRGHPGLLTPVSFAEIEGWTEDDHLAAFTALRAGAARLHDAAPKTRGLGVDGRALARVAAETL